jgi:hypothetical protein
MFVIEDESHAEHIGQYSNPAEAMAELRRLAELSWDEAPNRAPCMSWRTCGRRYELVEYDTSYATWRELKRTSILNVSAEGAAWTRDTDPNHLTK